MRKKVVFLPLQTILGSISLGIGYYLALTVKDPLTALTTFFLAVLLVIFGTYLLFNAGITVFLQILKKNKQYYYQPNNLISVSNLIFRMKKKCGWTSNHRYFVNNGFGDHVCSD